MDPKKLLFALFVLFISGSAIAQSSQAEIVFDKLEHDFGTIKEEDGIQTCTFTFENKGNAPLIVNNVHTSCGCTTPEWTQQPIAPGKKGFIKVSYNPKGRPGSFNKTVTVTTNSAKTQTILRVAGTVEPRPLTLNERYPTKIGTVRARTNLVVFAKIKQTQALTDSLEIVNDSDVPANLKFITPPKHIKVRVEPAILKPGEKGNIIITFDARQVDNYGYVLHRVYLNTDGKAEFRNSIGVSATIEEDFSLLSPEELKNAPVISFNTLRYDFGNIKEGEQAEFTFIVKNDGNAELILRDIQTSCGCTVVTPEKTIIAAGESVPMKVVFDSKGRGGRQNKSITIISNDPQHPTNTLRITSNVSEELTHNS